MKLNEWLPIIFGVIVIGVAVGIVIAIPFSNDKLDQATLIKICRDGTPILRKADGTIWARRTSFFAYRVEDETIVCSQ